MKLVDAEALPALHYTGHPYIDIGLATIAAYVEKQKPEELGKRDLVAISAYMARNYVINPLKSFLTVVFPNSGYSQSAYNRFPEKREIYLRHVLEAYTADTLDERDTFLGLPVADVSYDVDGKIEPGRAYRQHIPLLTGVGRINFCSEGRPGVPISGLALLAIQAFPLGCRKCQGRLLAVHSNNPDIVAHFASEFLTENRRLVLLAQESGSSKIEEPSQSPLTILVSTLLDAARMQRNARNDEESFSITAYHISNSGQGPGLDIYQLPFEVIGFLRLMLRADYASKWNAIVRHAWQKEKKSRKKNTAPFVPRYNRIYEDLFRLPGNARRFIRTYFLRIPRRGVDQQDPRGDYSFKAESQLVSWDVTSAFLKGVLNMEPARIEEIRKMGDRFAEYVQQQGDKRFYRALYTARRYWELRLALLRANRASLGAGAAPLITFDPYVDVFEYGEELERVDWSLARDLVLIRMTETLHKSGWFKANSDAIPDAKDLEDEED